MLAQDVFFAEIENGYRKETDDVYQLHGDCPDDFLR
jgi:hypothetical protein